MARSSAPTLTGVRDCGVMRCTSWREGSNQVRSDVVFRTSGSDGVPKNTSTDFSGAVRSIDDTLRFDPLQDLKQVRCFNRCNRFAAQSYARWRLLLSVDTVARAGYMVGVRQIFTTRYPMS